MNIPPSSQWSDSMQMLQSPVWSTASDCSPSTGISSGYPFTQQQQQQQQQQHKPMTKGFKSFPLKHEHRPSYLHQYWLNESKVKRHRGPAAPLTRATEWAELQRLQSTPTELEDFKALEAMLSTHTGLTVLYLYFSMSNIPIWKRDVFWSFLNCHVLTMKGACVMLAAVSLVVVSLSGELTFSSDKSWRRARPSPTCFCSRTFVCVRVCVEEGIARGQGLGMLSFCP